VTDKNKKSGGCSATGGDVPASSALPLLALALLGLAFRRRLSA